MIEMLMSAFILAIGILGLAMLQTMSLRATGGSKNLSFAVQLAEQMMDQMELEGRLTYSNASVGTGYVTPTSLTGLHYYNLASVDKFFNIDPAPGNVIPAGPPAGVVSPQFQLTMTQTVVAGIGLSDVTISVKFMDGYNQTTSQPINRTATITRRILHG
ncbi:MAG: hypothetical protein WCL21_19770 [Mariniphaga sp.]